MSVVSGSFCSLSIGDWLETYDILLYHCEKGRLMSCIRGKGILLNGCSALVYAMDVLNWYAINEIVKGELRMNDGEHWSRKVH